MAGFVIRYHVTGKDVVFRQTFTGNGVATVFNLTGAGGNFSFIRGLWSVVNIQTSKPSHATKYPSYKALYDSTNIFTRNRIKINYIDSAGNVVLFHPPIDGAQFCIWYWYRIQPGEILDAYLREEFVASMEVGEDHVHDPEDCLPDQSGHGGEFLTTDGSSSSWGLDSFTNLTQTPSSFIGQAGKVPAVNLAEDALEFVDDCPVYKYLKALGQAEGNHNFLDAVNWNTSKALIKYIKIVTNSANWDAWLYPDDNFNEVGIFPSAQIMAGGNGDENVQLDYPYWDTDETNEIHLKFIDNIGAETFDIYINAYQLK